LELDVLINAPLVDSLLKHCISAVDQSLLKPRLFGSFTHVGKNPCCWARIFRISLKLFLPLRYSSVIIACFSAQSLAEYDCIDGIIRISAIACIGKKFLS
jgi:hypothetical protein